MEVGKRYVVFSVRKTERGNVAVWVRAGHAQANRDGSTNVWLDVLPLDGKLHIREAAEAHTFAGTADTTQAPQTQSQSQPTVQLAETQFMGGH